MELIVLGVMAGLFFGSYALWRRTKPIPADAEVMPRALPPAERTLHTLQPSDVVTYLATDWIVEGTLTLNEDGRVTRLYRITDAAKERWMAARHGDDGALWLEEAPELALDASGPDAVSDRGMPYRLSERGTVAVTRVGAVDAKEAADKARLYLYAGAGAARILAVAWGDRVAAYRGERLPSSALELLPGR